MKLILIISMQLFIVGCVQINTPQVTQSKEVAQKHYVYKIYSANNVDYDINIESIENSLKEHNIDILSSRNMNYPFRIRYGKLNFESYHLLICTQKDTTSRLLAKYPKFAPFLSMQIPIWMSHDKVYSALLSYEYIAKMSAIPQDDKDLLLYVQNLNSAILSALPNANRSFFTNTTSYTDLSSYLSYPITILESETPLDYIADYEADFEGELQKYGIKVPYYQDVLIDYSDKKFVQRYDFFHIYSLEKLNALYISSKNYPQSGLILPLKFYIYKKRGYDKIYISYIVPTSMINVFDIKEKNVEDILNQYSKMIKDTLEYLKE